jgi:hypothetical protein
MSKVLWHGDVRGTVKALVWFATVDGQATSHYGASNGMDLAAGW